MVIVPLFASFITGFFGLTLALTATFLILLVLVQRGRGGGLAGALGGMGGSSAFGAKAGDIFTKITIGAAAVWIVLCIAAAKYSAPTSSRIDVQVNQGGSMSSLDTEEQQNQTEVPSTTPEATDGNESTSGTEVPAGSEESASKQEAVAETPVQE